MRNWQAFWRRILSLETARFLLALMALNYCAGAVLLLMTGSAIIDQDKEPVVTFALGQLFALSMLAFNRYFGRGGDEQATGKVEDPVHVENETGGDALPRELPLPEYGRE